MCLRVSLWIVESSGQQYMAKLKEKDKIVHHADIDYFHVVPGQEQGTWKGTTFLINMREAVMF